MGETLPIFDADFFIVIRWKKTALLNSSIDLCISEFSLSFQGNQGNAKVKKCVVPKPHTSVAQLSSDSQFVIIGTSTLWDIFSPDDVFRILLHAIPSDSNSCLCKLEPVVQIIHGYSSGVFKFSMLYYRNLEFLFTTFIL